MKKIFIAIDKRGMASVAGVNCTVIVDVSNRYVTGKLVVDQSLVDRSMVRMACS